MAMASNKAKTLIHKIVKKVRSQKYAEALRDLDKLNANLFDSPQLSQLANTRGVTMLLMGDGKRAIDCFHEAVVLNPDNLQARLNRDLLEADGYTFDSSALTTITQPISSHNDSAR